MTLHHHLPLRPFEATDDDHFNIRVAARAGDDSQIARVVAGRHKRSDDINSGFTEYEHR